MKKTMVRTLSLLLAILMLMGSVVLSVSAEDKKMIESIRVELDPDAKTLFKVNDAFDSNGVTIMAHFTDGTEEKIVTDIEYTGFDSSEKGSRVIHVTYNGVNGVSGNIGDTYTVYICAPTLMSVVTPPDKKTYAVNEEFDPKGLEVEATFSDDEGHTITETVSNKNLAFDYDFSKTGVKTINAAYTNNGKVYDKKRFNDLITGINVVEFANIVRVQGSYKTIYKVGDQFDPKDMELVVAYSDGNGFTDTGIVKEGFNCNSDFYRAGMLPVTVSYLGDEIKFNVQVLDLKYLEIDVEPKLVYTEDETFDPTGMVLIAHYADENGAIYPDEDVVVKTGFDCTADFTAVDENGKTDLIVTYKGKEFTFEKIVTVLSFVNFTVSGPDKTEYFVGDYFDPTGMKLTAHYSNGSEDKYVDVEDGFEYYPKRFETAGKPNVKVTYKGQEANISVTVYKLTSISVVTPPNKTSYERYQYLDPTGLQLRVTFSDGQGTGFEKIYNASDLNVTYDKRRLSQEGVQTITVSLQGKTATFDVYVYVLQAVRSVSISDVKMLFKTTTVLQPNIQADVGVKKDDLTIHYESADPSIARVDPDTGKVTAVCWGETEITVTVTDATLDAKGNPHTVSDTCKVTVRFSILQWIFRSLFGWIQNWK